MSGHFFQCSLTTGSIFFSQWPSMVHFSFYLIPVSGQFSYHRGIFYFPLTPGHPPTDHFFLLLITDAWALFFPLTIERVFFPPINHQFIFTLTAVWAFFSPTNQGHWWFFYFYLYFWFKNRNYDSLVLHHDHMLFGETFKLLLWSLWHLFSSLICKIK